MLARQNWKALEPLVAADRTTDSIDRLRRFAGLLIAWNRSVSNLISRNDEARIVDRHLRESVEPTRWLAQIGAARWLDFGSGAGLPAIPLAISGVGEQWTLVESRRTKTLFIRKAVEELGLDRIDVVLGRLEILVRDESIGTDYEAFTSRATLALGPTLTLASRIVAPGGTAFLWKGGRREEEMRADPRWRDDWDFVEERPIGDGRTFVCRFRRR